MRLRKAALVSAFAVVLTFFYACGGGGAPKDANGNSTAPHQRTGLAYRAFVSNRAAGAIDIVDYTRDQLSQVSIGTDSGPSALRLSPDGKTTVVYNNVSASLVSINNNTEQAQTSQPLYGLSDSFVIHSSDNKTAYAAVRNYPNASVAPGAVLVVDYTQPAITAVIPVANARWLALSNNNKTLLVMTDDSDSIQSLDLTKIDTTTTPVTVPSPVAIPGFSRPVAAFFSSDDSKAYVVSCGPECGGAQAGVQVYTVGTGVTGSVSVQGASAAAIDGTTMYVAGAPGGAGGTMQTVDLGAMTATAPVTIGSGIHTKVVLAGSKVWIGAKSCGASGGCLSVVDTTGTTALIDTVDLTVSGSHPAEVSRGDVTGMAWLSKRNLMYTVEGGELLIYDPANPTKNCPANSADTLCPVPPLTQTPILDIVGQAWDVIVVP